MKQRMNMWSLLVITMTPDDVVIIFSSPDYSIIKHIVHELETARRDGTVANINDFLNDIKHHYMNVGIGSNPFRCQRTDLLFVTSNI